MPIKRLGILFECHAFKAHIMAMFIRNLLSKQTLSARHLREELNSRHASLKEAKE
jgi:hypothetical protein